MSTLKEQVLRLLAILVIAAAGSMLVLQPATAEPAATEAAAEQVCNTPSGGSCDGDNCPVDPPTP
jgi:hypothetical protein